jgi:fructose-bisphosphate aldolase class 1
MNHNLETITAMLVAPGKDVLAAAETVPTVTKRFDTFGIQSLLKPNMMVPGQESSHPASEQEVATATLRCLRRHVPAAVPGIVFLSGGQEERVATAHLNAINRLPGSKPWTITFSFRRALQDPALEAWQSRDDNLKAGQQALYHRARRSGAASRGVYSDQMGGELVATGSAGHRRECLTTDFAGCLHIRGQAPRNAAAKNLIILDPEGVDHG